MQRNLARRPHPTFAHICAYHPVTSFLLSGPTGLAQQPEKLPSHTPQATDPGVAAHRRTSRFAGLWGGSSLVGLAPGRRNEREQAVERQLDEQKICIMHLQEEGKSFAGQLAEHEICILQLQEDVVDLGVRIESLEKSLAGQHLRSHHKLLAVLLAPDGRLSPCERRIHSHPGTLSTEPTRKKAREEEEEMGRRTAPGRPCGDPGTKGGPHRGSTKGKDPGWGRYPGGGTQG